MSLRELQQQSANYRLFVVMEPSVTSSVGTGDGGNTGADSTTQAASNNLAVSLGLIDPPTGTTDTAASVRCYRFLGLDPQFLVCNSGKLFASSAAFHPYDKPTNCPDLKDIGYLEVPKSSPIPYVNLDYFDTLIDPDDEELFDKPTADAHLDQLFFDGTRWHAKVTITGSYKGKHISTQVEFVYDVVQQELCVNFPSFQNKYIRVEDISICWELARSVICVKATAVWRADPHVVGHAEICIPVSSFAPQQACGLLQQPNVATGCGCCSPVTAE